MNMSETGMHPVVVVLTAADIEHVNNWAAANGFLDRAEAVQQLIRQGLRVAGKVRRRRRHRSSTRLVDIRPQNRPTLAIPPRSTFAEALTE